MNGLKQTFSWFRCWGVLYALTVLGCLPFVVHFIWGNHDWGWVKDYTPLFSGVFEGRFSQFILPIFLFSGNVLPVFSVMTAMGFLSLTAILLLKLWKMPEKNYIYLLLGLNITLAPYTISWFYFAFITLSCLSWTTVVVGGYSLLASKKVNSVISYVLCTVLFMLALGGYPPVINMIGVILFTLVLRDLCFEKFGFGQLFKKYFPYVCVIISSVVLFCVIQEFLKRYGLQYSTYNTEGTDLKSLPGKVLYSLQMSVEQFVVAKSFIGSIYKKLTLGVCLIALVLLWRELPKRPVNICLFVIALFGMLLSSVATTLAAANVKYVSMESRIEFFSLPYIYVFAGSVLFVSQTVWVRNTAMLVSCLLVLYNVNTMAFASKVWNLGFKGEVALADRFIDRLEENPKFLPSQQYTFVQGGTLDFRSRFYPKKDGEKVDGYVLSAPYIPWHLPYKAYTFYYPRVFVSDDFDIYWSYIDASKIPYSPSLKNYIFDFAAPWPSRRAVYVDPKIIILTLTKDGENAAKNWFFYNFK